MWRRSGTWSAKSAASWPTRTAWTRRRSRRPSTSCSSPRSSSSRWPTRRWRPTERAALHHRHRRRVLARPRISRKTLRGNRVFPDFVGKDAFEKKSWWNEKKFIQKKSSDLIQKNTYFWADCRQSKQLCFFAFLAVFVFSHGPSQVNFLMKSVHFYYPSFLCCLGVLHSCCRHWQPPLFWRLIFEPWLKN